MIRFYPDTGIQRPVSAASPPAYPALPEQRSGINGLDDRRFFPKLSLVFDLSARDATLDLMSLVPVRCGARIDLQRHREGERRRSRILHHPPDHRDSF